MFNGWYDNFSRPATPATSGDRLMMKWNDAWLSNQSCDTDTKLDRHYGFPTYRGSGAWLTNHLSATYPSSTAYHWNLDGNWVLGFNSTSWPSGNPYLHDMTVTGDTATGGTPSGGSYTQTWNASVTVTGDDVTIVANYITGPLAPGYVFTATATITGGGLIGGTWTDTLGDSGTWSSSSGTASQVYDTCTVSDFVKIVAAPTSAYHDATVTGYYDEGMWYTDDTKVTEIGPALWGDFAVIQEVASDPCGEYPDLLLKYQSEVRSGLGNWAD